MGIQQSTSGHVVSVVIPCYNVARTLGRCLQSIEAQPFRSLEVLCVNDGSTDASLAIMRDHAARDPRIRVIDKPNEGYGASCNRGIDEATGDYVAIVEPDDWVDPDMYGDLLRYADSLGAGPIDVVKSTYWRILRDERHHRDLRFHCDYQGRVHVGRQPFTIAEAPELLGHHPSIWTALYRRAWLDERGIRFREYPGAGWADNPWLVETLCQADSIAFVDRPYYCYRDNSVEGDLAAAKKNMMMPLERLNDMIDVLERLGVSDRGVWQMMDKRCSMYTGTAIQANGLDAPGLREAVTAVYRRLDHDRYLANPEIMPGAKRLFCELRGEPDPHVSDLSYVPQLVRQSVYTLRNNGLGYTWMKAQNFVLHHAEREGAR